MDDFVFEINNLSIRLKMLKKALKEGNKENEKSVFNDSRESVELWKKFNNAIIEYIHERKEPVRIGEVIYILSSFLNWHLEKALKEYYNNYNRG